LVGESVEGQGTNVGGEDNLVGHVCGAGTKKNNRIFRLFFFIPTTLDNPVNIL